VNPFGGFYIFPCDVLSWSVATGLVKRSDSPATSAGATVAGFRFGDGAVMDRCSNIEEDR